MSQPTTYTWDSDEIDFDVQYVADSQDVTADTSLTLKAPAVELAVASYPYFLITGDILAHEPEVTFTIQGKDQDLKVFEETILLDITSGVYSVIFPHRARQITKIVSDTDISLATIGLYFVDTVATKPYLCDVWNQNAQYSYSASIEQANGGLIITPQFTCVPMPRVQLVGQIPSVVTEKDWIVVPKESFLQGDFPFLAGNSYAGRMAEFPITALRFLVSDPEGTAKFTATIMQQGGFF